MSTTFSFIRQFLYSQLFVSLPYPVTDFTGKTVIVTGANTGLGFEAAKHFVRLNATKVIIACRNLEKGQAAKLNIENSLNHTNKNTIEVWQLDLSSFQSVKDFATKVNTLERLDTLVENAGIGTEIWTVTEGNESMITTNVISTELLALLVFPKLKETALRFNVLPRLSIVSSDLHFLLDFPERKEEDIFAALNDQKKSKIGERYQVTKLIEIFFVRSLASRLLANNKQQQVIVNCLTPGACSSDFFRDEGFLARLKKAMVTFVGLFIARTAEQGARTLVAGATAGMESHGQYMADCIVAKPSDLVLSEEGKLLQERLWEQTMKKLEAIQPGISKNIEP